MQATVTLPVSVVDQELEFVVSTILSPPVPPSPDFPAVPVSETPVSAHTPPWDKLDVLAVVPDVRALVEGVLRERTPFRR